MHLTTPQLATILAALRLYQKNGYGDPALAPFCDDEILTIATDDDALIPLDSTAINELCESLNFASQQTPLAFFKVRPSDDALSFIAWGALVPLTTEDPHSDPAEPVHYCFGATPEIATTRLQSEINSAHGMRTWVRQHSEHDSATKAMLRRVFKHFDEMSLQSDDIIIEQMRRWREDHERLHRLAENALA